MSKEKMYQNPILPGFYPDPSVCRVGEDFYLVTSSFVYFPGVPIFHSRDLVHWEQIGNVLNRRSQAEFGTQHHSGGIYAPTLRYHNGTFYLITTNVGAGGNFVVTAKDPAGPWSEPHFFEGAPDIDPSLFFDDDGKAYYIGTRQKKEDSRYFGDNQIWMQEFDLDTLKLVGDVHVLWEGALKNAVWPEGPHLYKKDGYYYLMIAEGGTEHNHSVTMARSKEITGPYEGNPANPVLTHRHLGLDYPIVNVGHGDLVDTPDGQWYMVLLGSRTYGGYYRNLGRETFLVPVEWENGWLIVNRGVGLVEKYHKVPNLPETIYPDKPACDHFDDAVLDDKWLTLRNVADGVVSVTERKGYLRLHTIPEKLTDPCAPSFVCLRQQHIDFSARTALEFKPAGDNEVAGMAIVQSDTYQYRLEYGMTNGSTVVRVVKCEAGEESVLAEKPFAAERVYLHIQQNGQELRFYYGETAAREQLLLDGADARILSTDVAGGFVGNCMGMYTSSNGSASDNCADFDYFEYTGRDE